MKIVMCGPNNAYRLYKNPENKKHIGFSYFSHKKIMLIRKKMIILQLKKLIIYKPT